MATPTLTFDDGSGSTTLTALAPRLGNWTPSPMLIGPNDVSLGSGISDQWVFRTDYTASFEFPNIQQSSLADLHRLAIWLRQGGTMTVATNDLDANSYSVLLKPASTGPTWTLDRQLLEYTATFEVLSATGVPLVVRYR